MARTWPVTRRKKLLLGAFDAVAAPISSVILREKRLPPAEIRKILVVELWHMGDVVLATSVLGSLRAMYPAARITLLAKEHARELLAGSSLLDEVVTYDFPWTAMSGKYSPGRYDRAAISSLVKRLRAESFDLSLDCRMDLRGNLLTRSIGAARRIGYDFGGGGFLLTDALPAPPADQHKVDDWMGLLAPLRRGQGDAGAPLSEPSLVVSEAETVEARRLLEKYEVGTSDLIIGVHPGGSYESKRWAADNFAEVSRRLGSRQGARVVVFIDPDGYGSDMQITSDAIFVRTSIREMMALFTRCDMLLCNDSGPMHVAAALGIPVVAVFRTGNPSAYGPRGVNHVVVGSGAPWGETSDVAVDDVFTAADSLLAGIAANRRSGTESRA